jgi:5-methyltetrahydropteroyltriglutamate--homocysteine methyltransferase
VDEAVGLQEAAGLDVVTDGEFRRYAFFGHLVEALDGFDRFGGWAIPFHGDQGEEMIYLIRRNFRKHLSDRGGVRWRPLIV